MDIQDYIDTAAQVLKDEAEALLDLIPTVKENYYRACQIILNCKGKVAVTGIGKSGHVGSKIAASFASTGTQAFFVNAGEAAHGDLGMIGDQDVVIALSHSGEGQELKTIIPILKRRGISLIAISGNPFSTLAKYSDVYLPAMISREAGPLNLAPTTSTTVEMAVGDALTVALIKARGFTKEDFAKSHPGGALGKRLLLRCADVMHVGDNIPRVAADCTIEDALFEMTKKGLGMVVVMNKDQTLAGVYTDGDLRRSLEKNCSMSDKIVTVMTVDCITISEDALAAEAIALMQKTQVSGLVVIDHDNKVLGAFNLQDLLRIGIL